MEKLAVFLLIMIRTTQDHAGYQISIPLIPVYSSVVRGFSGIKRFFLQLTETFNENIKALGCYVKLHPSLNIFKHENLTPVSKTTLIHAATSSCQFSLVE